ncbi:nitrite reductase [Bacillus sp. SCS-153A]|uniref:nitrite reductase n=1 Tax=Rossellomorea sedimentorum TaxID=3115294 RepID=UPI003905FAD4
MPVEKIKVAVNGGIGFGAKLTSKQLMIIANRIEDVELELTTFQQLYVEIPKDDAEEAIKEFEEAGLRCYPVGNVVKSLRTCNFCKGELAEGMPVAKEVNERNAGKEVPFTVKMAYTGCPVGCGEPLVNDIGIMKIKDKYNLYVGGKSKGKDAETGTLLFENLEPEELYLYIDRFLAKYQELGRKREGVAKFLKRIGFDEIKQSIM